MGRRGRILPRRRRVPGQGGLNAPDQPPKRRKEARMPVSDADMVRAWTHVLTLSQLKPQQSVTVLTSQDTNPQTLRTAIIAASGLGARVNRLDLPPAKDRKSTRLNSSH